MTMRLLCTTAQPTDHQHHSTMTVYSLSLTQKGHKAPLYCTGGGPGFSKCNIIFTAEYCAVDSSVIFMIN